MKPPVLRDAGAVRGLAGGAPRDGERSCGSASTRRPPASPASPGRRRSEQALQFGWIDGVRRSIDDESYTNRFTPRKPTSNWSRINVAKVEELKQRGLMAPAGPARATRRATPERTGVYSEAGASRRCCRPSSSACARTRRRPGGGSRGARPATASTATTGWSAPSGEETRRPLAATTCSAEGRTCRRWRDGPGSVTRAAPCDRWALPAPPSALVRSLLRAPQLRCGLLAPSAGACRRPTSLHPPRYSPTGRPSSRRPADTRSRSAHPRCRA